MLSKTQRKARAKRRRQVAWLKEQLGMRSCCLAHGGAVRRMLAREPHPVPNWAGATLLDWVELEMDELWNRQVKAARLVNRLMKTRPLF